MAEGGSFQADPGVLDGIAGTLRNAGANLDQVANSMPPTADAGAAAPAMANIMANLVDAAGQLVLGTAEAGDTVSSSAGTYADTDARNRDVVRDSGGG